MKNFLDFFFDFITGGFFNYLGALLRLPFSKKRYLDLSGESLSNSLGMMTTAIAIFLVIAYFKFIV